MSKWYVVWNGRQPGIYTTWAECQKQVQGFKGAMFKSFESKHAAIEAYGEPADVGIGVKKAVGSTEVAAANLTVLGETSRGAATLGTQPILPSISVDAACSGNPGVMEYRCVWTDSGETIFHEGPFERGTNNIGEFLALVDALVLCQKNGWTFPIYSDSINAMLWVRGKACKTTLTRDARTEKLWQRIEAAEVWLRSNRVMNKLLKWDTPNWGEVKADFGRK
jgi:ribonuclease HI